MSDLFGNHVVGFLTTRLIFFFSKIEMPFHILNRKFAFFDKALYIPGRAQLHLLLQMGGLTLGAFIYPTHTLSMSM